MITKHDVIYLVSNIKSSENMSSVLIVIQESIINNMYYHGLNRDIILIVVSNDSPIP